MFVVNARIGSFLHWLTPGGWSQQPHYAIKFETIDNARQADMSAPDNIGGLPFSERYISEVK